MLFGKVGLRDDETIMDLGKALSPLFPTNTNVCACLCACVCLCMCLHVCACVSFMCYACMFMCVPVHVGGCICACMCVSTCVYLYKCRCTHTCMHICIHAYMQGPHRGQRRIGCLSTSLPETGSFTTLVSESTSFWDLPISTSILLKLQALM